LLLPNKSPDVLTAKVVAVELSDQSKLVTDEATVKVRLGLLQVSVRPRGEPMLSDGGVLTVRLNAVEVNETTVVVELAKVTTTTTE